MVYLACTKTSKLHVLDVISLFSDMFKYLYARHTCRCSYENILLEMDRFLRPEGTVIIRDLEIEVSKVKKIFSGIRCKTKMLDHEDGPLVPEKILFVVKKYWVAGENNSPSST